jgi:hypothetical protein
MASFGKAALPVLITIGLYNALHVSSMTWTGLSPCPNVIEIPICYIVSVGYALMFMFSLSDQLIGNYAKPFFVGWSIVFTIASFGVGAELTLGNTCPKSGWTIPLCYISFMLCLIILYLHKRTRKLISAN